MYALSRNRSHLYLHDPDLGLKVPILICLTDLTYEIRTPSVCDLEEHYEVHDTHEIRHLDPLYRDITAQAMQASMRYTVLFGDKLPHLTVGELREMVEEQGL